MKLFLNVLAVTLFLLDHGVSGVETDRVSVMEGDSVTLHTGVQTNQQEDIKWYFSGTRIAQISGDLRDICTDVKCNEGTERFRDRLKLDHQTGSLTITDIRSTDSGVYHLQINSSSNSSFSFRRVKSFSVSVTSSGLSSKAAAGICAAVAVVLLVAATGSVVVVYSRRRRYTQAAQNNDDDDPKDISLSNGMPLNQTQAKASN